MVTIQELASRFLQYFQYQTRGEEHRYTLSDDAPQELRSLVEQAAGELPGDEWRYRFTYDALGVIARAECAEEECIETEIDSNELPRWLRSHPSRAVYVNTGIRDTTGLPDSEQFDIFEVIRVGYYLERNGVYWFVLDSLRRLTGGALA
jgi:hypothetical protein